MGMTNLIFESKLDVRFDTSDDARFTVAIIHAHKQHNVWMALYTATRVLSMNAGFECKRQSATHQATQNLDLGHKLLQRIAVYQRPVYLFQRHKAATPLGLSVRMQFSRL